MYDLHIHSTCSDGKYSRVELLKKMNDEDYKFCSFADHNYYSNDINSLNDAYFNLYGKKQNVELINCVELDITEYPRLHILGYDIKQSSKIEERLTNLAIKNKEICKKIVNNIYKNYSIYIPFDELEQMSYMSNVTKNIIVQWLIEHGYAKNLYEAGMLYTSQYSPCYEKRATLSLENAINLINECDGIAVMAHPSSMKFKEEELYRFVTYLQQIGIKGLEVYNADKTNSSQLEINLNIGNNLNLLTTSGSDFHREEETKILGVDNCYSEKFLKLIKERRK